jgi:hypothetical protein
MIVTTVISTLGIRDYLLLKKKILDYGSSLLIFVFLNFSIYI